MDDDAADRLDTGRSRPNAAGVAADHDRELTALGRPGPPLIGQSSTSTPSGREAAVELDAASRGETVLDDKTTAPACAQTLEPAVGDLEDLGRVGQHEQDDVALRGELTRRSRRGRCRARRPLPAAAAGSTSWTTTGSPARTRPVDDPAAEHADADDAAAQAVHRGLDESPRPARGRASLSATTNAPSRSTDRWKSSRTTIVVFASSTIAGPSSAAPGCEREAVVDRRLAHASRSAGDQTGAAARAARRVPRRAPPSSGSARASSSSPTTVTLAASTSIGISGDA